MEDKNEISADSELFWRVGISLKEGKEGLSAGSTLGMNMNEMSRNVKLTPTFVYLKTIQLSVSDSQRLTEDLQKFKSDIYIEWHSLKQDISE